jgi:DNA-damage-inducible protein D
MSKQPELKIFDDKQIRTFCDSEQEKWFVSIIDVITFLTESIDPNVYWRKLKAKLKKE